MAAWCRRRRGRSAYTWASITFSTADRCGSRWNDWKTKPIRRARTAARSRSLARPRSMPSMRSRPSVGRSRRPSRFSSVDLPDPDGPMIATCSPRQMVRSAGLSARTGGGPG